MNKSDLRELRAKLGIDKVNSVCSEETDVLTEKLKNGESLPDNIDVVEGNNYYNGGVSFKKYVISDLSKDEYFELLSLKQVYYLKTIKGWIQFFGLLLVIALSILAAMFLIGLIVLRNY